MSRVQMQSDLYFESGLRKYGTTVRKLMSTSFSKDVIRYKYGINFHEDPISFSRDMSEIVQKSAIS